MTLSETQVFSIFLAILLSMCAFFLTNFYNMVKKMMEDIKQILISDAHTEERLNRMEEEIERIERRVYRDNQN